MDAALFMKMLSDKRLMDLKKLKYKYPQADLDEFISLLKNGFYQPLPLKDFHGNSLVYLENMAKISLSAAKILLTPQNSGQLYGIRAMEEEIISTFTIENIDFSRDSVRKIISGYAPTDENEDRIYGMKKGLEFISDRSHAINDENIFRLYQMAIGAFLPEEDRLRPGHHYRHDAVYIVGETIEHTGIDWKKIQICMTDLITFASRETFMNDLIKAAVLHFYIAYLHPYFDGNGRMARLLHLWYLVQQGYSSALFLPFSEYINKNRKGYYDAYTLVERNARISGILDVTPFIVYCIENIYHKLGDAQPAPVTTQAFEELLAQGTITGKESALWHFVLSAYGGTTFSTKQLERDFGNAAYATIRSFVLKFEALGLLRCTKYGNRNRYQVAAG